MIRFYDKKRIIIYIALMEFTDAVETFLVHDIDPVILNINHSNSRQPAGHNMQKVWGPHTHFLFKMRGAEQKVLNDASLIIHY